MAESGSANQTSDSWELHFRRGFDFNGYTNTVKENNPYLTFPGTNFLYLPAKMSLAEAKDRFLEATNIKADFKLLIEKVIEQMYNVYKIAFGIINKSDSNYGNAYRSFQGQCDLLTGSINNFKDGGSKAWITNAGPGESWHNYGYAVDLGVWQWVDTSGNEYGPDWVKDGVFKDTDGNVVENKKNRDFWLAELSKKNSSAAHAIWRMRTELPDVTVYDLEGSEYIHLQMFPKNQSPTNELPVLLTNASANQWTYEKADIDVTSFPPHKLRRYKCNFGESKSYIVGAAHQMWKGDTTGIVVLPEQVTAGEGETIESAIDNKKAELAAKFSQVKTHMEQAQELAKTHEISLLNQVYGGYELQFDDKDYKPIWGGQPQSRGGAYVKELQQDLVKLGYWVSMPDSANGKGMSCDGHLGQNTVSAIKTFQLEHFCLDSNKNIDYSKIEMITGKVDNDTANKIKEEVNKVTGGIKWLRPAHHAQKTWSKNNEPKSGDYGDFYQLPPSKGYYRYFPTKGSRIEIEHEYLAGVKCKTFEVVPSQDCEWVWADCWGQKKMIDLLADVGEEWSMKNFDGVAAEPLLIGDISGFNGGPISPHITHQDGTGVDIDSSVYCSINTSTFDRIKSIALANLLETKGATRILFNCKYVVDNCTIAHASGGHANHFHVDVKPVDAPSAATQDEHLCKYCKVSVYNSCPENIRKTRTIDQLTA